MEEKFAGILDRIQRFYNKTKKKLTDTGRDLFSKKKKLSGTVEFRAAKTKAAEAIMSAGGDFEPNVKVWFGPDARILTVPNVGKMIVLKSGYAMKPVKVDDKYELKYFGKLQQKGLLQKLKNFFSSGKGKALTTEKKFVRVDPKSRQAIVADGGEIEQTILITFPAGAELVNLDGQELISLPDGVLLSVDNGIGPKSTIKFVGKAEKPKEEPKEEAPPDEEAPPEEGNKTRIPISAVR